MFKPFKFLSLTAVFLSAGAFVFHVQTSRPLLAQQAPAAQRPVAQAPAPQRESLKGAPDRRADEGKGPFKTLAIRNVMLIDGSGAPPAGPMDVLVSGNRISSVRSA